MKLKAQTTDKNTVSKSFYMANVEGWCNKPWRDTDGNYQFNDWMELAIYIDEDSSNLPDGEVTIRYIEEDNQGNILTDEEVYNIDIVK